MLDGLTPHYTTHLGAAYCGDARQLVRMIPDSSVDLVITSPPFVLQRPKAYSHFDPDRYVDELLAMAHAIQRVLTPTGSMVLDLAGAYHQGRPVRTLHPYRLLLRLCDEQGWQLAGEFFWYNPAALPAPIEWVNKRKIRVKDAVHLIWWLARTEYPKANVRNVLVPYSERMQRLLRTPHAIPHPMRRPSGHIISPRIARPAGGAIPSNLLQIPNTASNSQYLRWCRQLRIPPHPARFPERLPEFFVRLLTDVGDVILDPFAGSNTTGAVAEQLGRRWIAFEQNPSYLAASAFRFLPPCDESTIRDVYDRLARAEPAALPLPPRATHRHDPAGEEGSC